MPLDPTLPAERLAFIVRDCGIGVVLADDAAVRTLEAAAADLDATVVGPSDSLTLPTVTRAELAAAPVEFTPAGGPATDLDLAYIMYTSGSTGVPKGMMHCHRGSLAYARWGAQHGGLGAGDRVADGAVRRGP